MAASQGDPEPGAIASWTLGWRWVLHILALLALLVAVVTVFIGLADAVTAAAVVPRLIGLLLLVCGVALVIGAALVFRYALSPTHHTAHLWVAPLLFLSGAIPGLLLLILQVSGYVFEPRRVSAELVAFLVPVAAAFAVLRASGSGEARRVWGRVWQSHQTPTGRTVASLLSAGLVVTAGQSLLSYYEPVKRGDSLSITTNLVPADQDLSPMKEGGDVQALHGTVYVENVGDAKLLFLGGIYLVTGENVTLRSSKAQTELLQRTLQNEVADPRAQGQIGVGRYEARPKVSLVKTGVLYDPGTSWIAPGTKVEIHFLAYAPKKKFTRYVSTVQLLAARADRMELEASPKAGFAQRPGQFAGLAQVEVRRKIAETSWVNRVTRGTRNLYINYSIPADRILTEEASLWPGVTPCVAFKRSECSGRTPGKTAIQRWRATYGVNIFPAWHSLEIPAKP